MATVPVACLPEGRLGDRVSGRRAARSNNPTGINCGEWVSQAVAADSTPPVLASLDGLLAAALRVASPGALVTALCWALNLRREALQACGPARC